MNQRMLSVRILLRYTLLQLPGVAVLLLFLILVQRWVMIPSWLMWCLLGIWVAKDMVLYPFIWRSYDWDGADANHKMIGTRGIAKDRLNPSGYIIVRGELWKAEVDEGDVVEKGEKVLVSGIQGLTLLVKAETEMNARASLNHE